MNGENPEIFTCDRIKQILFQSVQDVRIEV